jgi:hypothetical protein
MNLDNVFRLSKSPCTNRTNYIIANFGIRSLYYLWVQVVLVFDTLIRQFLKKQHSHFSFVSRVQS